MSDQRQANELATRWAKLPLSSFAAKEANSFVDGPFGSDLKVSDYSDEGVRILQLQNLGEGFFIDENKKFTTERKAQSLARCLVRPDDLLIAKMADPLARACRVPKYLPTALIVADVIKLRPATEVDPRFLVAAINSYEFRNEAERLSTGTTRSRISLSALKRIQLPKPSPREQGNIGVISEAFDSTIDHSEALIAKYQQIKAGLMQDLFTRGLDGNGQLRSPREEAPELYKQSSLGWIPLDWTCEPVESLLANVPNSMRSGPFGSALLKSELAEDGIPLLGIDNIFNERFERAYSRFVPPFKFAGLSRYAVRPRDVVITIMGTVGRSCVLPDDIGRALSSKHLWTMTFDRQRVVPELICWQLNGAPWVSRWFAKHAQGGIMEAIQSSTLKTLRVPVPPLPEQEQFLQRYLAIQERLRHEEEQAAKLQLMKKGLMSALLTRGVSIHLRAEPAHV